MLLFALHVQFKGCDYSHIYAVKPYVHLLMQNERVDTTILHGSLEHLIPFGQLHHSRIMTIPHCNTV